MSDSQLPEHLAYIVDAVRYGKSIRHQADKLEAILAAAWAVAARSGRVVIPRYSDMTYTNKCGFCDRGMGQLCADDCPHRQLKEALADD